MARGVSSGILVGCYFRVNYISIYTECMRYLFTFIYDCSLAEPEEETRLVVDLCSLAGTSFIFLCYMCMYY